MSKRTMGLVLILFLIFPAVTCLGDEDPNGKDHICFMKIDSDQDEVVSFQEFSKVFGEDQEKYNAMDLDEDGNLTHDEYEEYRYSQDG